MTTLAKMEEAYILQTEYVEGESEDEFAYEEVSVDEPQESSGEEDLETALQNAHLSSQQSMLTPAQPSTSAHPEVVEDFVRNFLVEMGMNRTAGSFQAEWYELAQTGKLKDSNSQLLPDVYSQNRLLERKVDELEKELHSYKQAARVAKERYVRLKKERDFHRMHHRRVVQEKDKLLTDIKRMKRHFSGYEPMLQELKKKYQAVTREKMLACLEKDRAVSEVGCLQATLQSIPQQEPKPVPDSAPPPTKTQQTKPPELPPEPSNPYRQGSPPVCGHLSRTGGLQQTNHLQAHSLAVSSTALHPTKEILVTASDDHTWKMWAIPNGELLMTGEGHSDWLSSVEFHPNGQRLVSGSGDGTVRVWDLQQGRCEAVFPEHRQPVWGCSWHWTGDYVASGGMDHCCKVWETCSGQTLVTMRGHADSLNSVKFIPFSNSVLTCSADKTVSIWDARAGLCVQTFYGHQHSCNQATPTLQGLDVFSCDCFGTVIHWDTRAGSAITTWDFGPHAVNSLAVDPGGAVLVSACADGVLRIVELATQKEWVMEGHSDTALAVIFSNSGSSMISSDGQGKVILWQ